jgi:hypothetical protein
MKPLILSVREEGKKAVMASAGVTVKAPRKYEQREKSGGEKGKKKSRLFFSSCHFQPALPALAR